MKVIKRLMMSAGLLASLLVVGAVITGGEGDLIASAEAQGGGTCSERTIEGIYAFAIPGQVQGIGPIAISGTTSFDGFGGTTITLLANTVTQAPVLRATFSGIYTVDPDACTGSATYNIPPPGLLGRFTELRFEGVSVNDGAEIRYLVTTPGIVLAGTSVRQFPSD